MAVPRPGVKLVLPRWGIWRNRVLRGGRHRGSGPRARAGGGRFLAAEVLAGSIRYRGQHPGGPCVGAGRGSRAGTASESGRSVFISLGRARRAGRAAKVSGPRCLRGAQRPFAFFQAQRPSQQRLRRLTRRTDHRRWLAASRSSRARGSNPRSPGGDRAPGPPARPAVLSSFRLEGRGGREGPQRCPGHAAFAALSGPSRSSKSNAQANSRFGV